MSAITEDEAKAKACCAGLGIGSHKEGWMPSGAACIGSRCMAWRWADAMGKLVREEIREDPAIPDYIPNHKWVPERKEKRDGRTNWGLFASVGYCGLAGAP